MLQSAPTATVVPAAPLADPARSRTGWLRQGASRRARLQRIACLAAALAVTACADLSQQNSDLAFLARTVIVGQSRAQVLACAGKPQREEVKGEAETLTYFASSGDRTLVLGSGVLTNVPHSCEVTLVLRRGYVEDVRYTGRTGGLLTPGEECAAIVRQCMRPR